LLPAWAPGVPGRGDLVPRMSIAPPPEKIAIRRFGLLGEAAAA